MKISIIAAVADNNVIGKDNQLIWRLSDDLKNFKRITLGHFVIMGRKTYESIGKPLPGRTNLVLSRSSGFQPAGCLIFRSIEEALTYARSHRQEEVFVIGGAKVYHELIHRADKLYLTRVHTRPEGDAFFPEINFAEWSEISRRSVARSDRNDYDFEIIELER